MAITQGTGPHRAWLVVAGTQWPVMAGTVDQTALNHSASFDVRLPMDYPGAFAAFSAMQSGARAQVVVQNASGTQGNLVSNAYILRIRFDFVSTVISIHGEDQTWDLNQVKTNEAFVNQKHGQVVQTLVQRRGIPLGQVDQGSMMAGKKVKDTYTHLTDNITYATAIQYLAEQEGAKWWVDKDGKFNYKIGKNASDGSSYSVKWKRPTPQTPMVSDCLSLSITRNLPAAGGQEVNVPTWRPDDKAGSVGKGQNPGDGGYTTQHNYDHSNLQDQDANTRAQAYADYHSSFAMQIEAVVYGDPDCRAGGKLSVTGTGSFDGSYPMDQVTHSFGYQGYTTRINGKTDSGGGGGGGSADTSTPSSDGTVFSTGAPPIASSPGTP